MKHFGYDGIIDLTAASQSPGKPLKILDDIFYGPDVSFDLFRAAPGKGLAFIDRAKEALVPGTIPGHPQQ
jgi:hypothetical protein